MVMRGVVMADHECVSLPVPDPRCQRRPAGGGQTTLPLARWSHTRLAFSWRS